MWATLFSVTGLVIVAFIVGLALGACLYGLLRVGERVEMDTQKKQIENDRKLIDTQRQMLSNASDAMLAMTKKSPGEATPRRSA